MSVEQSYVIGVDYGTDSVRTIIVNTANGEEMASSVFQYPRWKQQLYCDARENQFRQHPLDYVEGLEHTVRDCVEKVGPEIAAHIKALSVDTTGSTPIATDASGTPLALLPGLEENANAMFVLWKDHTGVGEAAEINAHAQKFDTNYLQFVGGIYSSEWFWAKLLHILRADSAVRSKIHSFVEHCDWIPFLLTGGTDVSKMKRGVCAAGHKILWAKEWGGLPPNEFFATLDPLLDGFTSRLFKDTYPADQSAGVISAAWAEKLGLPKTTVIGVGAYDAHMGAVGGQIEPYHLSKVMGTSTCDMMVVPVSEMNGKLVRGICGQVPGSVIPGMMGLEAGQSAFGDAYAWFKNLISWPLRNVLGVGTDSANSNRAATDTADSVSAKIAATDHELLQQIIKEAEDAIIPELSKRAALLDISEDDELAIDWFNGRRTPDADQRLTAAFIGMDLGSDAVQLFRAVVESTCFGAKAIAERFIDQGIPVKGLIGLGGVAKKSPFIMQMLADVMDMPIRIHKSEQTCALGAAMFAATAGGVFAKVEDAMKQMGQGFDAEYHPDPSRAAIYKKRYERYVQVGDFLEKVTHGKI